MKFRIAAYVHVYCILDMLLFLDHFYRAVRVIYVSKMKNIASHSDCYSTIAVTGIVFHFTDISYTVYLRFLNTPLPLITNGLSKDGQFSPYAHSVGPYINLEVCIFNNHDTVTVCCLCSCW